MTSLVEHLEKLSIEDSSAGAILSHLSAESLYTLWATDNPDLAEDIIEKARENKKSPKLPKANALKEYALLAMNEAASKYLVQNMNKKELEAVLAPANIQHGDNKPTIPVFRKRLFEQFSNAEKGPGSIEEYVNKYLSKDKQSLQILNLALGVEITDSDSIKTLKQNIVDRSNLIGLEAYFGSFNTEVLCQIAYQEGFIKYHTSSRNALIESLVSRKAAKPAERKITTIEGPTKSEMKTKKSIAKSSYWGLMQHYNVEELKDFCIKNELKTPGRKDQVIKVILAFQEGDKENTRATRKMLDARERAAAKPRKTRRTRSTSTKRKPKKQVKQESESESEEEVKESKKKVEKKSVKKDSKKAVKPVKNETVEEESAPEEVAKDNKKKLAKRPVAKPAPKVESEAEEEEEEEEEKVVPEPVVEKKPTVAKTSSKKSAPAQVSEDEEEEEEAEEEEEEEVVEAKPVKKPATPPTNNKKAVVEKKVTPPVAKKAAPPTNKKSPKPTPETKKPVEESVEEPMDVDEEELDLERLEDYSLQVLKTFCEEEQIEVEGKSKKHYIKAILDANPAEEVEEEEEAENAPEETPAEEDPAEEEEEDGLDLDNLEQYSLAALKDYISAEGVPVKGKNPTKQDCIAAINKFADEQGW